MREALTNKNHWCRETSRWREDCTATRNPKAAKNLAFFRGALLAVIPFHEYDSLNGAMDHYANHPWQTIKLIKKLIIGAP
ncbi:hypothetical protein BSZ32_04630 [Rubritalea profundi]|uniref:Uncharacterized protein n=1 Tax=Rubritalea profundi TaxID=1658618 RepID=A0A2S7U0C9_9BACT|nr:hypothetical protein BSZ32_04630 [Rubritalea profundi]